MLKFSALIYCIIVFVSCNQQNREAQSSITDSNAVTTTANTQPVDSSTTDSSIVQSDSVLHINLLPNTDSLIAEGRLYTVGKPAICYVTIAKPTKIVATLSVKKDRANIRFNQIIMPDGRADGPFTKQLTYNLAQKGTYKILIGQDLMANNAYIGSFEVKVKALQ